MGILTNPLARCVAVALGSAAALLLTWFLPVGPAAWPAAAATSPAPAPPYRSLAGAAPQVASECGGLLFYDLITAPCSLTPVRVPNLAGVRAIAAGGIESGGFSLAMLSTGTLVAWGLNNFGQLGATTAETCPGSVEGADVALPCSRTPVPVQGISRASAIAAGDGHALALAREGGRSVPGRLRPAGPSGDALAGVAPTETVVRAWGLDDVAELGVVDTGQVCLEYLASGGTATRATTAAGAGRALPHIRFRGEGSGSGGALEAPCTPSSLVVQGLPPVRSIAAGGYHNLALTSRGVFTWGDNGFAQLGNGTYTTAQDPAWGSATPIAVSVPGQVIAMDAGLIHNLVVTSDGNVYGWGSNDSGQLGVNATESCLFQSLPTPCSTVPVQVAGISAVRTVAAGAFHSLALRRDGTVWEWGNFDPTPRQVPALTGVVAIAAGSFHSLALRSDGSVYAWGDNFAGQLGDGTTDGHLVPMRVEGLPRVRAIAAGLRHSMALAYDGSVWVWGSNATGELGVQLDAAASSLTRPARLAPLGSLPQP